MIRGQILKDLIISDDSILNMHTHINTMRTTSDIKHQLKTDTISVKPVRFYHESELEPWTERFDWLDKIGKYTGYLTRLPDPVNILPNHSLVDCHGRVLASDEPNLPPNQDYRHFETGSCETFLYFDWKALTKNYAHFYNDFLGTLYLVDKLGLHDRAILIPWYLVTWSVFRQICRRSPKILCFNWVLLPWDKALSVPKLWVVWYNAHWLRESVIRILDWLHVPIIHPNNQDSTNQKIFLDRSVHDGRLLTNRAAIDKVLKKYGFKTIILNSHSIEEQVELFANIRYLVAIHGAGIVNMIYRRGQPLSLLELIPSDMEWTQWFSHLSMLLDFPYSRIIGPIDLDSEQKTAFKNFTIDPEKFESILLIMLANNN